MRTLTALLLIAGVVLSCARVLALPDDARVPVLTYHSWEARYDEATGRCDIESEALARDLEVIYSEGYTVIPAYWLVEWVRGWRDGSTLPDRAVVITLDDGHDLDFLDNALPWHPCAPLRSMRAVLEEAAEWDWGGPKGMPVPHATTFVIGSAEARRHIDGEHMNHNWWPSAAAHPLLEVQNHSLDHDHNSIPDGAYDEYLGVDLTAGGGKGQMTSLRIDTAEENALYVDLAASYIWHKTAAGPDLFAYPFGPASEYSRTEYFPGQRDTVGAFCGSGGYVTRDSDPYCLPRFVHRSSPQYGGWRDAAELKEILRAASQ